MNVMNNMLINGEWVGVSEGARIDIINPATEEVVDSVPAATAAILKRI